MTRPMVWTPMVTVYLIVVTAPSMTLHCQATFTMIAMGMGTVPITIITDVLHPQAL